LSKKKLDEHKGPTVFLFNIKIVIIIIIFMKKSCELQQKFDYGAYVIE
jgi:hypothetical protein